MAERVRIEVADPGVCARVGRFLAGRGLSVVEGGAAAGALVVEFPGPRGCGIEAVREALGRSPRPAVVVLCKAGSIESGVAALKEGADDFLLAPIDLEELEVKLERALEVCALRRAAGADSGERSLAGPGVGEIVGESAAIRRVREQIARVAPSGATVLIAGETGTGKELVATAIHAGSRRWDRPLVKVNCAALPDPLLESELFGHERGAFTGAEQRRAGRFEEAHRGTLFLDEIGDMHVRTQAKVLRALQEQEFDRLGGGRPVRVDVRIIAATNQDLRERIRAGSFREDLFFRLDVVRIGLPSLRERTEDVAPLADLFLRQLDPEGAGSGRGVTPAALAALRAYAWPGNVRELRNALERALLMRSGAQIEVADLALPSLVGSPAHAASTALVRLPEEGVDLRDVERQLIVQALERSGWVQKRAAALLQMSRRKLNYRIQRLGITHPRWPRNRGVDGGGSRLC